MICIRCQKPLSNLLNPRDEQYCQCPWPKYTIATSNGTVGTITVVPVARTEIPRAYYDAFKEDTPA